MPESGWVYFIYDPDVPAVKIGKAKDVHSRLKTFLTANYNLQLIGVLPGYSRLEKDLHNRFAYARIAREWFYPVPDIMEMAMRSRNYKTHKTHKTHKKANRKNIKCAIIAMIAASWILFIIFNL